MRDNAAVSRHQVVRLERWKLRGSEVEHTWDRRLPLVSVVQPVQQSVDVPDLQLVVSDALQPPGNSLVVTLQVHLRTAAGGDMSVAYCSESPCEELDSPERGGTLQGKWRPRSWRQIPGLPPLGP